MAKKKVGKKHLKKKVGKKISIPESVGVPITMSEPEFYVLSRGVIVSKEKKLIGKGDKFKRSDVSEKVFDSLNERGLVAPLTTEKKGIITK